MQTIKSQLDTRSEGYRKNREDMIEMLDYVDEQFVEVTAGGGEDAMNRLRSRNKLPIRERVSLVLDRDAPFMEMSPLASWNSGETTGGAMLLGIGVISDVECLIVGNDPSVMAGASTGSGEAKKMRGLKICRENRIPFVQFVESAGANLSGNPGGGRRGGTGGGGTGGGGGAAEKRNPRKPALPAGLGHFAEGGRVFYEITELSKMRIPTISVVFGAATAGGAYQPGMSDYNIFVKKQAMVSHGGPPLVKMATGEDVTKESVGGAEMHTQISGLGDYLAEDEQDGIRMCREVVSHLNWRKEGPGPSLPPDEPIYDPEELLGIVSKSLKEAFDIREVIARIVDGSRFEDFKPRYGPELVCGWASIDGYPIGILGNNGALMSDSSDKAAQFVQLCNQIDVPLLFLHNLTGYRTDFEQGSITKNGSKMINAVSNSEVPHITVIVGASFGAGNFGMCGRAFDPRFAFIWPTARIVEPAQDTGFPALHATSSNSDDGLIDPRDTRKYISITLSACHNKKIEGARGFGVWRM